MLAVRNFTLTAKKKNGKTRTFSLLNKLFIQHMWILVPRKKISKLDEQIILRVEFGVQEKCQNQNINLCSTDHLYSTCTFWWLGKISNLEHKSLQNRLFIQYMQILVSRKNVKTRTQFYAEQAIYIVHVNFGAQERFSSARL